MDLRGIGDMSSELAALHEVFEGVKGAIPRVARQEDCQTYFMCELYYPEDALFVAPQADVAVAMDEALMNRQELLGSYRNAVGWGQGRRSTAAADASFELLMRAH